MLNPVSGLDTYTGRLKGRGCSRVQLLGQLLEILPRGGATLRKHNTSNRWSLRKPGLDSYMHGNIYMKLEVK